MNKVKSSLLLSCIVLITLTNTINCAVREFKGTDAQFDAILKEGKPVVIKFHQLWCPACKGYKNTFESVSKEFPNITFLAVDCAAHKSIEQRFKFGGYPTTIFFNAAGSIQDQQSGALSAEGLRQKVKKLQ